MENYIEAVKEIARLPKETASVYLIEVINQYQDEYELQFEEAFEDITNVYVDCLLCKL